MSSAAGEVARGQWRLDGRWQCDCRGSKSVETRRCKSCGCVKPKVLHRRMAATCRKGHALTADNLYVCKVKDRPNPKRICKVCDGERKRKFLHSGSRLSEAYKERRRRANRVDVNGTRIRPIGRQHICLSTAISLDKQFPNRGRKSFFESFTWLDILPSKEPDPAIMLMQKEDYMIRGGFFETRRDGEPVRQWSRMQSERAAALPVAAQP